MKYGTLGAILGCSNISREWFNENLIAKIALSYFLSHPEQKCREPVPEPTNGTVPEPEAEPRIRTPVKKLVNLDNISETAYRQCIYYNLSVLCTAGVLAMGST